MMKSEFEILIKKEVSEDEYNQIEMVYMYYPGINNKEEMAQLYVIGGKILMSDMHDRAIKIKRCEEIINVQKQLKESLSR